LRLYAGEHLEDAVRRRHQRPSRRVAEHAQRLTPGFTAKYHVESLVYFEACGEIETAIAREKQLKGWRRSKKIKLIESLNPEWNDLSNEELTH